MNRLKIIGCITAYGLAWQLAIFQSSAYAQPNLAESVDCTKIHIDYANDPTLTREERIRRMDEAFYKSLNKFELCQSKQEQSATTSGGTGGGGDNASGESGNANPSSEETNTNGSGQGSVASSTMSGTESPDENSDVTDVETSDSNIDTTSNTTDNANTANGMQDMTANGQRPDDIPPSDNDNALAAQIRYAAEKETDPVKKEQLWNEYRKYKGLPLKK